MQGQKYNSLVICQVFFLKPDNIGVYTTCGGAYTGVIRFIALFTNHLSSIAHRCAAHKIVGVVGFHIPHMVCIGLVHPSIQCFVVFKAKVFEALNVNAKIVGADKLRVFDAAAPGAK